MVLLSYYFSDKNSTPVPIPFGIPYHLSKDRYRLLTMVISCSGIPCSPPWSTTTLDLGVFSLEVSPRPVTFWVASVCASSPLLFPGLERKKEGTSEENHGGWPSVSVPVYFYPKRHRPETPVSRLGSCRLLLRSCPVISIPPRLSLIGFNSCWLLSCTAATKQHCYETTLLRNHTVTKPHYYEKYGNRDLTTST